MKPSLLFFLFALFSYDALSAIYGEDERELLGQTNSSQYAYWGKSVAAMLRTEPQGLNEHEVIIKTKTLNEHVGNLCSEQAFFEKPTFARCTGFLVSDQLLVTAGHCINNHQECLKSNWAFTSESNTENGDIILDKKNLFKCKRVVSRIKNHLSKNDYSLIELDRKVDQRPFLNFRKEKRIDNNAELLVIGHPTGLPLITTDRGKILENSSDFLFKISSDTFAGNSGSPVINLKTGLVEGILTDGGTDYFLNKDRKCKETYKCSSEKKCKGEFVVRITNIPQLVPGMPPKEPVIDLERPRL